MSGIWIASGDGGRLGLAGRLVSRMVFDFAVELVLDGGVSIRVETMLEVSGPNGRSVRTDPEALSDEGVLAVHQLLRKEVVSADVIGQRLRIVFVDGVVLDVPPDPDYEAWSVVDATGERLVAVPGADLAHWSAK